MVEGANLDGTLLLASAFYSLSRWIKTCERAFETQKITSRYQKFYACDVIILLHIEFLLAGCWMWFPALRVSIEFAWCSLQEKREGRLNNMYGDVSCVIY